jgi:hypothetical protein
MLIVCKTCACSYHIPREILDEGGCRLRCVGCGEEWVISSGAVVDEPPLVEGQRAVGPPPPAVGRGMASRVAVGSPRAESAWRGDCEASPEPTGAADSRRSGKGARATLAALTIVASAMAAVAARAAIVRAVPTTAPLFAAVGLPVNLLGLALDNVHSSLFDLGDRKILVVEGAIVNLRDAATPAPDLRIALRGADKHEIYSWTAPAPRSRLGPDEQVGFRTRLAAPPDGVTDVMVRFAAGDGLSPPGE